MKFLKENNILNETEELDNRVKQLKQKISRLDDYAQRHGYDAVIIFDGIKDTVENHMNKYKDELAKIYDSKEFFEESKNFDLDEALGLKEGVGYKFIIIDEEDDCIKDDNGEPLVFEFIEDASEYIDNNNLDNVRIVKKESLKEGISKNMTAKDIAEKHGVSVEDIRKQLEIGVKVEKEHTDDEKKAERIALDHLFEIPNYYDKLDKMEKSALKESNDYSYETIKNQILDKNFSKKLLLQKVYNSLTRGEISKTQYKELVDEINSRVEGPLQEDTNSSKVVNPERIAKSLAKQLARKELHYDVHIYVNGKRYTIDDNGNLVYDIDADPRDYFKYVREPNILSMSFEGPLYDEINYDNIELLQPFFEKYGLFYELGNAWNLSVYAINDKDDAEWDKLLSDLNPNAFNESLKENKSLKEELDENGEELWQPGDVVRIKKEWLEKYEDPNKDYIVFEDYGNGRVKVFSESKLSVFGGYTNVWGKEMMYKIGHIDLDQQKKNESLKESKDNLTIEDMFNSVGVENVFDKNGYFTQEAEEKYEEVGKKFFDNMDEFDELCAEEHCFEIIGEKLIQGKSEETVRKNTETEIKAGKDPKQAYAIAKSIQKKNMKESFEDEHLGEVDNFDDDEYIELDRKAVMEDDYEKEIIELGKERWVKTPKDEEVWDSLSDDDKYFLSMSNDMGFWFDDIQGNEEFEDRYYQLSSKFSKSKSIEESLDDEADYFNGEDTNESDNEIEYDDEIEIYGLDEQLEKETDPKKKEEIQVEIDRVDKEINYADDHNNPAEVIKLQQEMSELNEETEEEKIQKELEKGDDESVFTEDELKLTDDDLDILNHMGNI